MEIQYAVDLIFDGNCILFTGAGAATTALNISNNTLKPAHQLTELLFEKCDVESNDNLSDAVDEYLEKFGEFGLIKLLKDEYTVKEIQPEHQVLGSVRWKRIYTTNYDGVLEMAYSANSKVLTSVTLTDKLFNYKDKSRVCVHLNGYIGRLTPDTLKGEFKLSDTSYLVTTDFLDNEWISLFKNDLAVSDAIFFVGFSLRYDLDLKRIIYSNEKLRDKCFFITRENEHETNVKSLRKFGTPFSIGLKNFAETISARSETYIPKQKNPIQFHSFSQPEIHTVPSDIKDIDFYQLLFEGKIDHALLQFSLFNPNDYHYYLERDETAGVIKDIDNGSKNFVVLSDLGNGKTLFINGLKLLLKNSGYEVFEFNRYYDTIEKEIEEICTNIERPVLFIENYSKHLDVIEKIKLLKTDLVLILTERHLVNDISQSKLEEILTGEIIPVDLNRLSENEIDKVIFLLDKYGFIGDLSAYSDDRKRNHFREKCHNNFREILIDRIKSQNILDRFRSIVENFETKRFYSDAITLILASKLFDFRLELDDLTYIFVELLNDREFTRDSGVKEFVNFYRQEISVTSSVLAEAILVEVLSPTDVVTTMIKVCKKLNSRREDKNIRDILRSIVSFSNMQRILRKDITNQYKYSILNFFEEIKNLEFCNHNPHFWLQYAIARLSERDYAIADSYFQTAYAYAKNRPSFDTYQIDNHYARQILENENYNGETETCMSQFLKAHKILANPQSENRTRHYPFKVARNYFPFYERFFNKINEQDKIVYLRCCKEILNRIDDYLRNVEAYRVRRDVKEAKNLLETILQREKEWLSKPNAKPGPA